MNKMELIEKVAQDSQLKVSEAKKAVESLINTVIGSLKAGDDIALAGLGIFKVKERKARAARNPKTGEIIQVPAGKRIAFKVSSGLKKEIK
ncbi:HU family DNA-binding protein [bacterium]|nr:HU family DNA-binding protein [bacterium]